MKFRYLTLLVPILFLAVVSVAGQQIQKFDILSFTPPAGWDEKKSDEARVYSKMNEKTGAFCLITLIRPVQSKGDSKTDFDTAWQVVVTDQLKVVSKPQRGESGEKQGWTAETGIAPFETEDLKGAAMLTTLTANGRVVAVLALTNSEAHAKDIEAFVDGIMLPQAAAEKPTTGAPAADSSRLTGKWNRSSSGVPTYGDPVAWGTAGYTKSRYEFKADGTYLYTERSFRMMMENIIIVKETGKYSVSGSSLTISPAKSVISSYKKAGGVDALGPLVKSQNRDLEPITYKFNFHFFEGIKEWNLVLQADKPTQRDGPFSNNPTFQNAWYFDQQYTDNDLTSIKAN